MSMLHLTKHRNFHLDDDVLSADHAICPAKRGDAMYLYRLSYSAG